MSEFEFFLQEQLTLLGSVPLGWHGFKYAPFQVNVITDTLHNQISANLFKHIQEILVVTAKKPNKKQTNKQTNKQTKKKQQKKKLKFLVTLVQRNCPIKDQNLLQSAGTLTSFYR